MTYLFIITLESSPTPSQITHTLFDIISLDVDAVYCHDQDTSKTVHTCARIKMPQYNIVNNVYLFSDDWFQGNSMCIDMRQNNYEIWNMSDFPVDQPPVHVDMPNLNLFME